MSMTQQMAEARPMTNTTARPMPVAVSTLEEQPRNGQIPRNWEKMKLLTRIAPREMEMMLVSIILHPPLLPLFQPLLFSLRIS